MQKSIKFVRICSLSIIISIIVWTISGLDSKILNPNNWLGGYCPGCEHKLYARTDVLRSCPHCGYKFVLYQEELTNGR